jgi:hypothetical protein
MITIVFQEDKRSEHHSRKTNFISKNIRESGLIPEVSKELNNRTSKQTICLDSKS